VQSANLRKKEKKESLSRLSLHSSIPPANWHGRKKRKKESWKFSKRGGEGKEYVCLLDIYLRHLYSLALGEKKGEKKKGNAGVDLGKKGKRKSRSRPSSFSYRDFRGGREKKEKKERRVRGKKRGKGEKKERSTFN